ncbi:MAG: hypothetical protein PHV37_05145 [Candidatus Gastranaerophilales bacterium]|nr:hypothetical protein [Candidatus Gastranaerophilales bacterium]
MSEDKEFKNVLEKIQIQLDKIAALDEGDIIELKNKLREITDTMAQENSVENFSEIKDKIKSLDNTNSDMKTTMKNLIDKTSSMIEKLSSTDHSSIIKLQTFLTDLSYQISKLKEEVQHNDSENSKYIDEVFDELRDTIEKSQEEISDSFKVNFEGVNTSFQGLVENVLDKLNELNSTFETYNNNLVKDVIEAVNSQKESLAKMSSDLEEFKESDTSILLEEVKQKLASLHESLSAELKEMITTASDKQDIQILKAVSIKNTDGIQQFLSQIQEDSIEQTKDIIKKLKEQNEIFEDLDLVEKINKLDVIYDNISILNSWVEKIDLIKENLSSVSAKIENFPDVQNKVNAVYNNISVLSECSEKLDNIDAKLDDSTTDKVDIIYENVSSLNEWAQKLDAINAKIDDDTSDKVDVIYENISNLNIWAKKLDNIDKQVAEIDSKLAQKTSSQLQKIDEQLSTLDSKVELYAQPTEDEEANSDKIDIIYENISLLNGWANTLDSVNDEVSNISSWGFKIEEIREKLENLSNEFEIITTATKDDTDEYIYTLLDIESDFAKLHCALEEKEQEKKEFLENITEVSTNTVEDIQVIKNCFEELNDDISSISKRTNKLILTSDEANKTFNNHLFEFSKLIDDLHKKIAAFNPIKQYSLLENKANTIKKLVASNLASSKSLNEAFIYLAEWVDSTGSIINSIQENVINVTPQLDVMKAQMNNIEENSSKVDIIELKVKFDDLVEKLNSISKEKTELISSNVNQLKLTMASALDNQKNDIKNEVKIEMTSLNKDITSKQEENKTAVITAISGIQNRVENLETKMDSLENKLNSIDEKLAKLVAKADEEPEENTPNELAEMKTVMDFIASQVISANENSINNKVLNQKMEVMEHQLAKFEKNIARIVSYLDED